MNAFAAALYAVWTLSKVTTPCEAEPCGQFKAVDGDGNEKIVNVIDAFPIVTSVDDMTEFGKLHMGSVALTVKGDFVAGLAETFRIDSIVRGAAMRPGSSTGANVGRDDSTTGTSGTVSAQPPAPTRAQPAGYRRPN